MTKRKLFLILGIGFIFALTLGGILGYVSLNTRNTSTDSKSLVEVNTIQREYGSNAYNEFANLGFSLDIEEILSYSKDKYIIFDELYYSNLVYRNILTISNFHKSIKKTKFLEENIDPLFSNLNEELESFQNINKLPKNYENFHNIYLKEIIEPYVFLSRNLESSFKDSRREDFFKYSSLEDKFAAKVEYCLSKIRTSSLF